MLPQVFVRSAAPIIIVIFILSFACSVRADSFNDTLTAGKSLATDIKGTYVPGNITPGNIVPQYNAAEGQQGTYTGYYTNPGGMSGAASGEALDLVRNSYETRTKYDLSDDPTFGTACLETDAEGKCTMWSLSKDLLTNTYPDCEKVLIPEYETAGIETCTDETTVDITADCSVRRYLETLTEHVAGPCSSVDPGVHDNQIYAICKDDIDLYRVYAGTVSNPPADWADVRSLLCSQIGGCSCFGDCRTDTLVAGSEAELPEGSVYVTQGLNIDNCSGGEGSRVCNASWYKYYAKANPSTIERLFLRADRSCSEETLNDWSERCTLWDLAKCDASGLNCTYLVKDGVLTGNAAAEECRQYPSTLETHGVSSVLYDTDAYNACAAVCPVNKAVCYDSCLTGYQQCLDSCPGDNPDCPLICDNTYNRDCRNTCNNNETACYQSCYNTTSFPINNYNVCSASDGSGLTLNDIELASEPGADFIFNTVENGYLNISWKMLFGGNGVDSKINNWYTKLRFACRNESTTCANLVERGCVLSNQSCLDEGCTQHQYEYTCGQSRITGYTVAYNCAGEIRCMGTECTTASYEANKNMGAAAAAGEVLNMSRVDSIKTGDNFEIFPGKIMECQSSPENCCRPTTGGFSIGDYVSMGLDMYSMYRYAGGGIQGVASQYANIITSWGNSIANSIGMAASTTATVEAGGTCVTSTTITSGLGTSTMTTTMTGAEFVSTATFTSPAGVISAAGTVMSVVGLVYTAYSVLNTVYDMMYACTKDDMETSVKVGYHLCHYVDTSDEDEYFGFITQSYDRYCCFNSILARILHEQARPQLGIGWGGGKAALNCRGLTTQELASIDFSQIDLSEYTQYIARKTDLSQEEINSLIENIREKYESP